MTTTDMPPTPAPAPTRRLRRSRTDRIGAGVAGGLGEYFDVDPVLFRVLFATAAFFGGAGVLGYLLAWAVIPDEGTERAALDGWIAEVRRRRVPFWVVAVAAGLAFWIVAFSWWAPGHFFPVIAVVALLVAVFSRRTYRDAGRPPAAGPGATDPDAPTAVVNLHKAPAGSPAPPAAPTRPSEGPGGPEWLHETRRWIDESRAATRARIRRATPVRVTTLLLLLAALGSIGVVDAVSGVPLPVYLWTALAVLGAGLLAGLLLRRTPWSLIGLLVPTALGLVAFAGTHAGLHDGTGVREWAPVSAPAPRYALAFGQTTLDLTGLAPQDRPRTIRIDQAAGQVRIIAPPTLRLTVLANVHIGVVTVDGDVALGTAGGVGVRRELNPPAGATGEPIVVDVHLADGNVDVRHTS